MQEEVEQKSLTLTVNAAKMTARLFRAAIAKYVAHKKEKKHDAQTGVRYVGRQSVKKLVGQNQGVSNVELSGEDIKAFERVARKYGVDYAVKKVKGDSPRFLIFFKARDAYSITSHALDTDIHFHTVSFRLRRTVFCILPLIVLGISVTNSTRRIHLYSASF